MNKKLKNFLNKRLTSGTGGHTLWGGGSDAR